MITRGVIEERAPSPVGEASAPSRPIDTAGLMPNETLRRVYRWVQPAVEAAFGFPALWRHYDRSVSAGITGPRFAAAFLSGLGVRWAIAPSERERLRAMAGPIVVACNHPHGGIDSLALVQLLEEIRPGGWRMFSNQVICSVPALAPTLIAVDPLGRGADSGLRNRRGLAQALGHLKSGGLLCLFPAARVSHWDRGLQAVCDRPWSDHAVRLAEKTGASLVCLHIPGQNSRGFLAIPPAWSRFRALALCREFVRPPARPLNLRLAAVFSPSEVCRLARLPAPGGRLRAWCYLRADRDLVRPEPRAERSHSSRVAVAGAGDALALRNEIERLPAGARLGQSPDGEIEVLLFRGREAPLALLELGRCREITFRAAGQGVGRDRDLAPEDDYYHHLVLWHRTHARILGAYRLGVTAEILAERGPSGLYLGHVFSIRPAFFARLGPAIELSRSFVVPEQQRDNQALALLWRGLGAAAQRFGCPTFFGSVTISNEHHPASRALLVEHLRRNHADEPALCRLVQARRPFQSAAKYHPLVAESFRGQAIEELAPLIDSLEEGQRSIPPLMRYYCSLGARFLAFHVEAEFQDALYCLLRVDLGKIPAGYRRRFLGGPLSAKTAPHGLADDRGQIGLDAAGVPSPGTTTNDGRSSVSS